MKRLWAVGDALSQLLNVALLPRIGETNANESVSGRAYRQGWRRTERFINALIFWEKDHCRVSYEADVQRAKDLLGVANASRSSAG